MSEPHNKCVKAPEEFFPFMDKHEQLPSSARSQWKSCLVRGEGCYGDKQIKLN